MINGKYAPRNACKNTIIMPERQIISTQICIETCNGKPKKKTCNVGIRRPKIPSDR